MYKMQNNSSNFLPTYGIRFPDFSEMISGRVFGVVSLASKYPGPGKSGKVVFCTRPAPRRKTTTPKSLELIGTNSVEAR